MSKVFIIDDDPIHQRIAQIMLLKHKVFDEFTSFLEAEKALDFLNEHIDDADSLPDVILLDLNMPVVDGWEFLEQFEPLNGEFAKEIRIFIVSSSVDEKDISRSQAYSFVKGFFSKPLTPDILKKTI